MVSVPLDNFHVQVPVLPLLAANDTILLESNIHTTRANDITSLVFFISTSPFCNTYFHIYIIHISRGVCQYKHGFLRFVHNWHFHQQAFISRRILSATMAINSLFVGFPLLESIVYPKKSLSISGLPLSQATSIACLMALSTLEAVVL